MLSFFDRHSHLGRREFLRVGGLTLGGLGCRDRLQAGAAANAPLVKDKSVIFLFLHGGPSQFETFDPKMSAPSRHPSATGEIATALPGVTFGSTFPKLARLADRLTDRPLVHDRRRQPRHQADREPATRSGPTSARSTPASPAQTIR